MNDASSDDARSLAARVTKAGEAVGEHVRSAAAATAAAAGHVQKTVQDATAATAAVAGQAKEVFGDVGVTAQQAWSQAGEAVADVVEAGHHVHRSVSRQIHENPLMAILIGGVLGYVAGWWLHGSRRSGKIEEG
jgi:ABC-type transporter Mla subunit MlaD